MGCTLAHRNFAPSWSSNNAQNRFACVASKPIAITVSHFCGFESGTHQVLSRESGCTTYDSREYLCISSLNRDKFLKIPRHQCSDLMGNHEIVMKKRIRTQQVGNQVSFCSPLPIYSDNPFTLILASQNVTRDRLVKRIDICCASHSELFGSRCIGTALGLCRPSSSVYEWCCHLRLPRYRLLGT